MMVHKYWHRMIGIIDEVNNIASAVDIKSPGNPDLIQIIGEDIYR